MIMNNESDGSRQKMLESLEFNYQFNVNDLKGNPQTF